MTGRFRSPLIQRVLLSRELFPRRFAVENSFHNKWYLWKFIIGFRQCSKTVSLPKQTTLFEMKSIKLLLVFSLCISVGGYGLKCHTCSSDKGWFECNKNQKERICQPSENTCVALHGRSRYANKYFKGCGFKTMCNGTTSICKMKVYIECKISCCSRDLCNWA